MSRPLSVYIRTKNEERMIGDVVRAAASLADDIVLIDSGSTDRTIEIAEAAGARVVRHAWLGWGKQKRLGEDACQHNWVFDLDADEIITPELAAEILALFARGEPPCPVYELFMATVPPIGKPWMNFNLVDRRKLYDRRVIRQPDDAMADQFKLPAGMKVGRLRSRLLHHSFTDLAQLAHKFNRHSSDSANTNRLKPFWVVATRMIIGKPVYFMNHYVRRGLWRAGWYGLAVAGISAHGRWLKDAKMMEIHQRKRAAERSKPAQS